MIVSVESKYATGFFSERGNEFRISDNILKAYQYDNILEALVSWKNGYARPRLGGALSTRDFKFFYIDPLTLTKTEFLIKDIDITVPDLLCVDRYMFKSLMKCGVTCSHWLQNGDEWIAFPKPADYKNVNNIRYYARGLIDVISSHGNWWRRNKPTSWHPSYESQWHLMKHPLIMKIYLNGFDGCKEFTVKII